MIFTSDAPFRYVGCTGPTNEDDYEGHEYQVIKIYSPIILIIIPIKFVQLITQNSYNYFNIILKIISIKLL